MASNKSKTSTIIINERSTSPRERIIPIRVENQRKNDDYDDDDYSDENIDSFHRRPDDSVDEKRKNVKVIKVSQGTQQDDENHHKDYAVRITDDRTQNKSIDPNRSSSIKKTKNPDTSSSSDSSSDSDIDVDDHKRQKRKSTKSNLLSLDKGERKHSIEIINTTIEGLEGSTGQQVKTSFKKQSGREKNRNRSDINNNTAITIQPGKSILKASSPPPQPIASSTPIPSERPISPSNVIRKKPSTGSRCKSWLCSPFAVCCACAPFECEWCNCCYWKCYRCQQCFCQCCNQKCC